VAPSIKSQKNDWFGLF